MATNNGLTVALDITLSEELKNEGLAREFINRIQNIRKDHGFEVTDQIKVLVEKNDLIMTAIKNNLNYICEETLAKQLKYEEKNVSQPIKITLIDNILVNVSVEKI